MKVDRDVGYIQLLGYAIKAKEADLGHKLTVNEALEVGHQVHMLLTRNRVEYAIEWPVLRATFWNEDYDKII